MSIISKAKKGNEEAFIALIEEHRVQMYKTAKSILKNEEDTCDALQEALISIYKNINSLKEEKYLKTWMIRITINKCYDIINKGSRNNEKIEKVLSNPHEEILENSNNICLKIDLEKALSLIDNDLKTVTVLYYYDDLNIKDIADVLDIPVGTVKSKLSRAREKLYRILMQEEVNNIG